MNQWIKIEIQIQIEIEIEIAIETEIEIEIACQSISLECTAYLDVVDQTIIHRFDGTRQQFWVQLGSEVEFVCYLSLE